MMQAYCVVPSARRREMVQVLVRNSELALLSHRKESLLKRFFASPEHDGKVRSTKGLLAVLRRPSDCEQSMNVLRARPTDANQVGHLSITPRERERSR